MTVPPWQPTVPREELEARIAAFREALAGDGIDAAVIVQSTDLYYFAGTTQSAHLVIPVDAEPVLLVRRTLERARAESALERVEPLASLAGLAEALSRAGVRAGTLGFELDVLPAARLFDYQRRLPGFEIADCSPAVRRVRAIKSPWELERIREAGRMLEGVGDCVASVLRAGMTELELAAEVEAWLRRRGHQGVLRMRGFNGEIHYGTVVAGPTGAEPGGSDTPLVGRGPNPAVGKGPSSRAIQPGEPVVVDLVGSSLGYLCDQTRTFSLGPLPARLREAHERAVEILHGVAAAARPGVAGSELYALANELAGDRRAWFASAERISFVGHGFGLEIDEPPFLARSWQDPLEEGMVFALEPKFVFPGLGAVGIENSYAVRSGGVEVLTHEPEALVEL